MNTKKLNQNKRAKQFLALLGHGRTIYECEAENDRIDEYLSTLSHQIKSRSILR